MSDLNRFIIVPGDNIFNHDAQTTSFELHASLSKLGLGKRARRTSFNEAIGSVKVIDSVDLNDATLVEMADEQAFAIQQRYPSLRVAPEGRLEMCRARLSSRVRDRKLSSAASRPFELHIVSATNDPIIGAEVEIFVSKTDGILVDELVSDAEGVVKFKLPGNVVSVDLVSIMPRARYWPVAFAAVPIDPATDKLTFNVIEIPEGFNDALAHMHGDAGGGKGKGVKIAVVDGGASLPKDPFVRYCLNYVNGEDPKDASDNGTGHGTHVAGIIKRVAPEAEIRIYRVCGENSRFAEETAIAKAMRDAIADGCDLINLSIGQESEPLAITRQVRRARSLGCVVVAAAGNRWGSPVEYPARTQGVVAVSACGVSSAAPESAVMDDISAAPPGHANGVYFAQFSNVGDEIDLIAPGVAILSQVSPVEIGCMDGTSMACPAIIGLAARLLSSMPTLLLAERDQQRSDDLISALLEKAEELGFGRQHEGVGKLTI